MNISELKKILRDKFQEYFVNATVVYAEQAMVKPQLPYVTLKTNGITRNLFPARDEDKRIYFCTTRLEINLYTNGELVHEDGYEDIYINDALEDMTDFLNWLESDMVTQELSQLDISIVPTYPIKDLTELINDTRYRYRSYIEGTVSFIMDASGDYGVLNQRMVPNSAGGGDERFMIEQPTVETIDEIKED